MSLLQKASGVEKTGEALPGVGTSLFRRAIAASRPAPRPSPASPYAEQASPAISAEEAPLPAVHTAPETPGFLDLDALENLKAKLSSLPPCQDSILSAWSILAAELPLRAIALFLPRGDFLARAAEIGFPAGAGEDIPISIAPSQPLNGRFLGDEAKALLAPSLGVGVGLDMRAASICSPKGVCGLWIYHDDSLDSASDEVQIKVSEILSDTVSVFPALSIASPPDDAARLLMSRMGKYRFATILRYGITPSYAEREAFRGLSSSAIRAAFTAASEKLLDQTGAVVGIGESSAACALGSSARCDHELALFQLTKTLKRSLPFLAAEAFPAASSMCLELSADDALEGLSRFLSA